MGNHGDYFEQEKVADAQSEAGVEGHRPATQTPLTSEGCNINSEYIPEVQE